MKKRILALLLGGLFLTACPGRIPDIHFSGAYIKFSLPAPVNQADAQVVAYANLYEAGASEPSLQIVAQDYIYNLQASLYISQNELDQLSSDQRCVGPFKGGQDTRDLNPATLVVKPENVNTCQVFFVLYSDANGDGVPQEQEVVYDTNDQFVYADQDFSYSGQDNTHTATEQGSRTRGWSLVRHSVIQPSATPGHYQVTMNSEAPSSVDGGPPSYQIRLHEKTNFFSSMSVGVRK